MKTLKILLVSDNHLDKNVLIDLFNIYQDMDLYLHSGDSEMNSEDIYPFSSVKGNCDYFSSFPNKLIITTPIGNILMKHKLIISEEEIKKDDIKIFVHGHTHIPEIRKEQNLIVLCPGSLNFPRSKYQRTYMILEIKNETLTINLYSFEDKKILISKQYRIK